jgi:hypothetical protein
MDVADSSFFQSYIGPDNFSDLAKMMVEADPEKAIKAFGLALQQAEVVRRKPEAT